MENNTANDTTIFSKDMAPIEENERAEFREKINTSIGGRNKQWD